MIFVWIFIFNAYDSFSTMRDAYGLLKVPSYVMKNAWLGHYVNKIVGTLENFIIGISIIDHIIWKFFRKFNRLKNGEDQKSWNKLKRYPCWRVLSCCFFFLWWVGIGCKCNIAFRQFSNENNSILNAFG